MDAGGEAEGDPASVRSVPWMASETSVRRAPDDRGRDLEGSDLVIGNEAVRLGGAVEALDDPVVGSGRLAQWLGELVLVGVSSG